MIVAAMIVAVMLVAVVMIVVVMIVTVKCFLCIAYGIIGVSSKNDHDLKFGGRGVGQNPIRSFYLILSHKLPISRHTSDPFRRKAFQL